MWRAFLDELVKIAAELADTTPASDYAHGLPKKTDFRQLPTLSKTKMQMNIQEHLARRAGPHWDVRFQDPEEPVAYSWAVPKMRLPEKPGEKILAVRQPDHRASYMGFSGIIESGYGEGKVTSKFLGPVQVEEANASKIKFKHLDGDYTLHRTGDDKKWLIRRVR